MIQRKLIPLSFKNISLFCPPCAWLSVGCRHLHTRFCAARCLSHLSHIMSHMAPPCQLNMTGSLSIPFVSFCRPTPVHLQVNKAVFTWYKFNYVVTLTFLHSVSFILFNFYAGRRYFKFTFCHVTAMPTMQSTVLAVWDVTNHCFGSVWPGHTLQTCLLFLLFYVRAGSPPASGCVWLTRHELQCPPLETPLYSVLNNRRTCTCLLSCFHRTKFFRIIFRICTGVLVHSYSNPEPVWRV